MEQRKTLIAIDGNSLLHRAYYALPNMTSRDGTPTGALHGFLSMLVLLLQRNPEYLLVAFDMHGPTFRHERYSEYKAGRRETPDDLRKQFPVLKELLTEMNIAVIECPQYEADDILGTMSLRGEEQGLNVLLVTGDRDALQLVTEHTHVLLTKKGITDTIEYDPEVLFQTYGLTPNRMRDLKGLMGDTSDHIPGIPGVGEKTALKLLAEYGSLEGVLLHASEIKGKLGERIRENRESAELSYWLGTIDTRAPIDQDPEDCVFLSANMAKASKRLYSLDLRNIASRLPVNDSASSIDVSVPMECVEVTSVDEVKRLLSSLERPKKLAIDASQSISFAFSDEVSYFASAGETLFDTGLAPEELFTELKSILEDASIPKYVFDGKALHHRLAAQKISVRGTVYDAMISDYLLHTIRPVNSFMQLCEQYYQGKKPAAGYLFQFMEKQLIELKEKDMENLYFKMELPLSDVLMQMEREGFYVDAEVLSELQNQFDMRIHELQTKIYEFAGETFNILSPKQLGIILFDKLGLPVQRKTKSGYSTDAETLDRLKDMHPMIPLLLEYRFLAKLKSTFVDGLLAVRNPADGRVRSRFNQCLTATGRISSSEPNLQNIPVRTELGREIRKAFVASEGCVLIDADYSQIELRILAHLSNDEKMIAAFHSGEDIHRKTASEIFGVPFDDVTSEMRNAAKAVNFGIIYGISDFGLSNNLGIPVKQAGDYIRRYLERYPKVEDFMKNCVALGKERGYAITMFGRRRELPEVKSSNYNTRSFGERVAMNMPIQGSAADIIKLAMVTVAQRLKDEGYQAKLLLQVHDELILDTPFDEADRVETLLRECMEGVCALSVPLIADIKRGSSWYETK